MTIPLVRDGSGDNQRTVGFSLESPCHGSLLGARFRDNGTLEVELPFHGIMLDIHSEDDISVKVRSWTFNFTWWAILGVIDSPLNERPNSGYDVYLITGSTAS